MYVTRLLYLSLMFAFCSTTSAQESRLHAEYDKKTSKVVFYWNMINNPAKTTYVLLKSSDGKKWSAVVTDKIMRAYTEDDIFDYDEKFTPGNSYYYRLKIIDAGNKTIAVSNTEKINGEIEKGSWVLYPSPVNDILQLTYKGNGFIKGVIHVLVHDFSGKLVIRFRSASIYKMLQIPVSNLRKGAYVAQVIVMNEVMLSQQFIKQ